VRIVCRTMRFRSRPPPRGPLRISAETLYVRAGILDERGDPPDLVAAVVRDPSLSERQKQVLLEIYRSFQQDDREDAAG